MATRDATEVEGERALGERLLDDPRRADAYAQRRDALNHEKLTRLDPWFFDRLTVDVRAESRRMTVRSSGIRRLEDVARRPPEPAQLRQGAPRRRSRTPRAMLQPGSDPLQGRRTSRRRSSRW